MIGLSVQHSMPKTQSSWLHGYLVMNVIDLTLLVVFNGNVKHYYPTAAQRRNRRSKLVTFLILEEITVLDSILVAVSLEHVRKTPLQC